MTSKFWVKPSALLLGQCSKFSHLKKNHFGTLFKISMARNFTILSNSQLFHFLPCLRVCNCSVREEHVHCPTLVHVLSITDNSFKITPVTTWGWYWHSHSQMMLVCPFLRSNSIGRSISCLKWCRHAIFFRTVGIDMTILDGTYMRSTRCSWCYHALYIWY